MKKSLAKSKNHLNKLIVDTTDRFGRQVFLAQETYNKHILKQHPEVEKHFSKYVDAVENPDRVVVSETKENAEVHIKLDVLPGPEFHANTVIQYPLGRIATMYPSRTKKMGKVKWP